MLLASINDLVVRKEAPVVLRHVLVPPSNRIQASLEATSITGVNPTLTVALAESNDVQNWADDPDFTMEFTAIGFQQLQSQPIAARFVRLELSVSGPDGSAFIVSGEITTARL